MPARCISRRQLLACSATAGATLASFCLVGCSSGSSDTTKNANSTSNAASEKITTGPVSAIRDTDYNGIFVGMTHDEFLDLGFKLGDSVDITLSIGKTYEDVPFYDGLNTFTGNPILVTYQGSYPPEFTRAQKGILDECNISEGDTITVTLREAGKYLAIQQSLSLAYSNDRNDYASDVAFANFRACKGGKLRENLIYRSASPINNTYNRATYANALVEGAGVQYSLDLSDNEESFNKYAAQVGDSCKYYADLCAAGKVRFSKIGSDYSADGSKKVLGAAFVDMCNQTGPYLIHCVEGKDRTGIACMLAEALAGASLDEMIDDYMTTYDNYYHVNESSDPERYKSIKDVKCYDTLMIVAGVSSAEAVTTEKLHTGAEQYLREGGLTDDQISQIKAVLTQ